MGPGTSGNAVRSLQTHTRRRRRRRWTTGSSNKDPASFLFREERKEINQCDRGRDRAPFSKCNSLNRIWERRPISISGSGETKCDGGKQNTHTPGEDDAKSFQHLLSIVNVPSNRYGDHLSEKRKGRASFPMPFSSYFMILFRSESL